NMFDRRLLGELKILGEDLKHSKDKESFEWFKSILSKITEKIAETEAKAKTETEVTDQDLISTEEKISAPSTPLMPEISEGATTEELEVVDEPPEPQIPVPPEPKVILPTNKDIPESEKTAKPEKTELPEEIEEVKITSKKPHTTKKSKKQAFSKLKKERK
ncbi:MAG: hypothetical protein ACFFCW_21215, partial [Candidatus Hodarchaeota archaeon]